MERENMFGKMVNIMKESLKMDSETGRVDGIFHQKLLTKDNLRVTLNMVMEGNHFKMEITMKVNLFKG